MQGPSAQGGVTEQAAVIVGEVIVAVSPPSVLQLPLPPICIAIDPSRKGVR